MVSTTLGEEDPVPLMRLLFIVLVVENAPVLVLEIGPWSLEIAQIHKSSYPGQFLGRRQVHKHELAQMTPSPPHPRKHEV